jgi:hypothetical protein
MLEIDLQLKLRNLIAQWTDQNEGKAAGFADSHRDLLPRRITNSQLYGLANVVRSARNYVDLKYFIEHQADKALRRGRKDEQGYWLDLGKALASLKDEAYRMLAQISSKLASNKEYLEQTHRQLSSIYVQRLIEHSFY